MLCPEAKLAGESDFTPDQMEFIQQLYSQGVIPSTISDIISKLVGKEFNSTTISNIERKLERAIDEAYGIDLKMTFVQKHLNNLDCMKHFNFFPCILSYVKIFIFCFFEVRMGISCICFIHQAVSGFSVYQGKGLTNHGNFL